MPFDRQNNLVFLHIPKTAGSSIEQALGLFGPWQTENLNTGFGSFKPRSARPQLSSNYLQHLRLTELERLFPEVLMDAQLFTVVRDPWHGCSPLPLPRPGPGGLVSLANPSGSTPASA